MKHSLVFAILAFAATSYGGVWQLSIHGTSNFSNFSRTEMYPSYFNMKYNSETSYGGGAAIIGRITEYTKVSLGVDYKSLGTHYETFGPADEIVPVRRTYDYLIVGFRLILISSSGLFVHVGPSLGVRTSSQIQWNDGMPLDIDGKDARVGAVAGIGIEIHVGGITLAPQVSYDFGVTDARAGESDDILRASSFSTSVALLFDL